MGKRPEMKVSVVTKDRVKAVTPLNPQIYTYDPAQPDAPYASAAMRTFGGHTRQNSPYRLADQAGTDEIILGYDPVELDDQQIVSVDDDVFRRSAAYIWFNSYNVTADNQYLLVFGLRDHGYRPDVQFFVGLDFVRQDTVASMNDQIAILIDAEPNQFINLFMRLAAPEEQHYERVGDSWG
jgi:hypothetical protein